MVTATSAEGVLTLARALSDTFGFALLVAVILMWFTTPGPTATGTLTGIMIWLVAFAANVICAGTPVRFAQLWSDVRLMVNVSVLRPLLVTTKVNTVFPPGATTMSPDGVTDTPATVVNLAFCSKLSSAIGVDDAVAKAVAFSRAAAGAA